MYSLKTSNEFVKSENIIFAKDQIAYLDCYNIENLEVRVEGKRLKWPKFVWCIHNLFAHPITQLLALCKLYKWAFWIHDVTVPKPVGKKK
jgi:hypothetical protein